MATQHDETQWRCAPHCLLCAWRMVFMVNSAGVRGIIFVWQRKRHQWGTTSAMCWRALGRSAVGVGALRTHQHLRQATGAVAGITLDVWRLAWRRWRRAITAGAALSYRPVDGGGSDQTTVAGDRFSYCLATASARASHRAVLGRRGTAFYGCWLRGEQRMAPIMRRSSMAAT